VYFVYDTGKDFLFPELHNYPASGYNLFLQGLRNAVGKEFWNGYG
jgi:hypothetical protein